MYVVVRIRSCRRWSRLLLLIGLPLPGRWWWLLDTRFLPVMRPHRRVDDGFSAYMRIRKHSSIESGLRPHYFLFRTKNRRF